jgi:lysophospholipase L1-like esterase
VSRQRAWRVAPFFLAQGPLAMGGILALGFACILSSCQAPPPNKTSPTSASVSEGRKVAQKNQVPETFKKVDTAPATSNTSKPAPSTSTEGKPPQRRYVVAALGDSITDAHSGGGGYLKELERACPESVFHNFGKGGDMTNQMRRRWVLTIQSQAKSLGLTTLLVYGGVNDLYSDQSANRKNARIEEDLSEIYNSARKLGLEVIAVTVSPWGGFSKYFNPRRGDNTLLLNSWIMGQVGSGLVDKAIDSYSLLSCGDRTRLCPDYQSRFQDGLHPGAKGHKLLGKKLLEEAFFDCL